MMATRDRVTFDLVLPLLAFLVIVLLSWLVPVRAYAQSTAPPRFSFPPIIESVTPSTGITASGARLSARVPGLEPEMLDYYESKMQSTPTPDGGVKYGGPRTAKVRVSPTDVIDVPFTETIKANKTTIGKGVAKAAKVLPIVGNLVALAELAEWGIDYANGGFVTRPEILGTPTSSWTPTCTGSIRNKEFYAYLNGRAYKYIYKANEGPTSQPYPTAPPDTTDFTYVQVAQCSFGSSASPPYIAIRGWRETPRVGFPAHPAGTPSTDAEVEAAVVKAIDKDVSAAIRMAQLAGRHAIGEIGSDAAVDWVASQQSTPARQESVTQTDRPDGSVDTSTTMVQTTVTPTVSGSTIGNGSMTLNSNSTYTTSTTNNVTNNTSVTQTTVNNNGGGSAPKADEVKIEVCGLPNTPPCKIDESGTPSPQDGKAAMTGAEITAAREAAQSTLETVTGPKEFGFSFPSLFPEPSCSPLTWFKWKSYEGSVDLCEKLGFLRTLLMWLWPVLAAKYVWGRTVSANVGA